MTAYTLPAPDAPAEELVVEDRWIYGGIPDAGRHPAVPEYRLEYREWGWALVDNLTNHEVSRHRLARDAEKEALRLARKKMVMR